MADPIIALQVMLLLFAGVAFAGAGAALAVARQRKLMEAERDAGMLLVAGALVAIGAACARIAGGWLTVPSVGILVVWASYVLTAVRLGMFSVETTQSRESPQPAEPRQRT